MIEAVFPVVEAIGIVAFGLSGYLVARRRCLDVYGTIVLALVTALGGGTLRDLVLGRLPPSNLVSPLAVALAAGLPLLLALKPVDRLLHRVNSDRSLTLAPALLVADAVGLAAFTVSGVSFAQATGDSVTLALFCGVITATGGGMMRDLLAGVVPAVLRREIYAVASLVGAAGMVGLDALGVPSVVGITVAMSITFLVRISAALLQLHLPVPSGCEAEGEEADP